MSDLSDTTDVFSHVEDFEYYHGGGNDFVAKQAADAIHNSSLNTDLNALEKAEIFHRTGESV